MFKKSLVQKTKLPIATVLGDIIHVWHTPFRVTSVSQLPSVSMERSWHIQQSVQYIWVSGINLDSIKAPFLLPHKVKMPYISTCGYLFNKKNPVLLEYMRSPCLMHSTQGRYFLSEKKALKRKCLSFQKWLPFCHHA